jgi:predicted nucleotidyltransferase
MCSVFTIAELQAALIPIFSRYGIRKAVLFGSYAKQNATARSDIDLLVDSGLRGLRFVGLMEEIHRAVGKDVDIFDVSHIEKDSLIDREIRSSGVTVYEE